MPFRPRRYKHLASMWPVHDAGGHSSKPAVFTAYRMANMGVKYKLEGVEDEG